MGRPRNLKLVIGSAVCFLSVCAAAVGAYSVATLAKYRETKSVGQLVSRNGIANTSLFLNPNIWTTGTTSSGDPVTPVYYMWVILEDVLVVPSKHVVHEVSSTMMDLYVFEFKYSWIQNSRGIIFLRANPDVAISDYSTFPTSAVWNRTNDIPYSNFLGHSDAYNYICITGWTNSGGGYSNSGYSTNRIIKDPSTGELTWLNS